MFWLGAASERAKNGIESLFKPAKASGVLIKGDMQ